MKRRIAYQRSLAWVALLVIGSFAPARAQLELELDRLDPSRPPRAALFVAEGFPTVDAPAIDAAVLEAALDALPVDRLESVEELGRRLRLRNYDLLILPYGSAFPLEVWIPIRAFLRGGGGLVALGGAPFHQPVLESAPGVFELGVRQPTFAHELMIGPAERWERGTAQLEAVALAEHGWSSVTGKPQTVWELTLRLATVKDLPSEHGSEGHRDAVLRPLEHLVDERGIPRACPLLEIDYLRGPAAGARWVLAPSDAVLDAAAIRTIVERALQGAVELEARPVHASVEPSEVPRIRVALRRPFVRSGESVPTEVELEVRDDAGRTVQRGRVMLTGEPEARHGELAIVTDEPLAPGLYHAEVVGTDSGLVPLVATAGFWVKDEALLAAGPQVGVSRDWLRKDGEVFPIVGTTYMASDIHRKFLFEPNPHVWDRDFARMADLGVNFVRNGLWTAWSRAMLNSGAIDEGFLRALDAFVQTSAKHGVVLNFTFFAFLPEAYGGTNPYLDPRSIEGQRDLLTLVARRYRGVGWVHWDLINEPSYAPPEGLWSTRPIGDRYETRAWKEWVLARHGDDPEVLRNRWQDPTRDLFAQPGIDEFYYTAIREHRRPRKVRDFVVFTQEVVADWAALLRQFLRTAGGDVLVTLGQDEGGTFTRSSQQLHAEAIDYTGVHPWWRNDDLLATGVMAKVPEKPNLFQETGLMRLEDLDGWPWRTPELAARVLERKFAYAFASRGGGVIEWAWNINPYQPIDNESVIGFFRPDGTAKPELRIVPELARFFEKAVPYLDDFEPDEVVAVIPHSRLFMGRPGGAEGFKRMIRVLAECYGVVPTGLSELRLTPERLAAAKLVLVPAPLVLEDSAAEALLAASRRGAKVLVTGAVRGNPYGEIPEALDALGVVAPTRPLRLREQTRWGDGWATFDRDLREQMERRVGGELGSLGGAVWHEPLPLEFAREEEPLAELLGAALEAAGMETHPDDDHVVARVLIAPRAFLVVVVNETDRDAERTVTIEERRVDIPVEANRSRLVLFERGSGRLIAATAGAPIADR